jgi:hypothetical protein
MAPGPGLYYKDQHGGSWHNIRKTVTSALYFGMIAVDLGAIQ